ncbi:hypothetical protein BJF78_03280 [Pseudonocardia sp. CNS-139]|nr:hypothetical protein BJF78_03280 [Pseudonocardia sp. CNS-139]
MAGAAGRTRATAAGPGGAGAARGVLRGCAGTRPIRLRGVGPMWRTALMVAENLALLDRPVYGMSRAARLLGLRTDGLRRWVDGYERKGTTHRPVIRERTTGADIVTWGEFVEAGHLREYRSQQVSLQYLRPARNWDERRAPGRRGAGRSGPGSEGESRTRATPLEPPRLLRDRGHRASVATGRDEGNAGFRPDRASGARPGPAADHDDSR